MIFSTPVFFAFFVVYFALHFAVPRQHRLWLIITGSTVFYAWWKIEYLWIPFVLMAIAWFGGRWRVVGGDGWAGCARDGRDAAG